MNMIVVAQTTEWGQVVIWCLIALGVCLFFAPLAIWVHLADFKEQQKKRDAETAKTLGSVVKILERIDRHMSEEDLPAEVNTVEIKTGGPTPMRRVIRRRLGGAVVAAE